MDVGIIETGAKETLKLIDHNGTNFVEDVIGNYDGFGDESHQFSYDNDTDVYSCTQSTFEWWNRVLADQQALTNRIAELSELHGAEAVHSAIGTAGDCDLEDQAAAINKELDQAFGVSEGN